MPWLHSQSGALVSINVWSEKARATIELQRSSTASALSAAF